MSSEKVTIKDLLIAGGGLVLALVSGVILAITLDLISNLN